MDPIIYVLLGFLILAVLGIGVTLMVFIFKKKPVVGPIVDPAQAQSFGEVKAKLEELNRAIPSAVNQSLGEVKGQLSKEIAEQVNKQGEQTNIKLERFQSTINASIDVKFGALDTQVNQKFGGFDTKIDNKFVEINKMVNEGLKGGFETTKNAVGEVEKRLIAIDQTQKGLNDLSANVVDLTSILSGNQSRGQFGEMTLEMILHSVFGDTTNPPIYEMQYVIPGTKGVDAVRPDAVVFMPEPNKMLCIDSKFPYQDYKRLFDKHKDEDEAMLQKAFKIAVKKHIEDVRGKYIIPGVTAVQALLFIPSDGVFVYVHSNFPDLVNDARDANVILTSPSTLQPILATIKMLRINYERSQNYVELSVELNRLGNDFKKFAEEWVKFSANIDALANKSDGLDKRVSQITRKFDKIKASDIGEITEETALIVDSEK
ncbi:MAG: DNA recombination protein RmuC [Firmicutes bacterium]|nr:DNA recombination protein RmuC [Bacillota bacterium]